MDIVNFSIFFACTSSSLSKGNPIFLSRAGWNLRLVNASISEIATR